MSNDRSVVRSDSSVSKTKVGTLTVERKSLTHSISLPGTIVAFNQATLYGKVAGYLQSIRVDKGDRVRRGQVLAVLEVPEMADEVDHARAVYQEALAAVEQAKADARLQAVTYRRFNEVHAKDPDAIASQELDQYRSKSEVAAANVTLAEAKVATAQANLNRFIALNRYASVTAPFDGIVTARYVDPGALIQAATSSTQDQAIVTIQDLDTIRVYVSIPEVDVPFVRVGIPISLMTGAYPGRVFRSSVTRFAEALDPSTRTMKTEIDIRNLSHTLRPGMYADVTFEIAKPSSALVIPATALVVEGARRHVWVVRNGRAHLVAIETGLDNGREVEIRSGLNEGEQVVVAGKDNLSEGKSVDASLSSGSGF
jgi:RND family efflux transporter MFP subunit